VEEQKEVPWAAERPRALLSSFAVGEEVEREEL
jgi:hypothetical protein